MIYFIRLNPIEELNEIGGVSDVAVMQE
jgi:hypothetical protein